MYDVTIDIQADSEGPELADIECARCGCHGHTAYWHWQRWAQRGSTTQRGYGRTRSQAKTAARGYGGEHQRLRAQWKPKVDAGQVMCHAVVCLKPTRQIWPGESWHLGHTPDRTSWTGPEHEKCNESDGAVRGNKQRATIRTTPLPLRTSRRW